MLVLGSGYVSVDAGKDWAGDVDVTEVEVEILEGWSGKSAALLLSRERRWVPADIIVPTD